MLKVIHLAIVLLAFQIALAQKPYLGSKSPKTNYPVSGMKGVKEIIKNEFEYPKEAFNNGVEGLVTINFTLTKSGQVLITEFKGVDNKTLQNETARILKKIQFNTLSSRIETVGTEFFSIEYSIKNWNKLVKKRGYSSIIYPVTPIDSTEKLHTYRKLKELPKPIFDQGESYNGFNEYMLKKMQYPPEAMKLGLKGEVVISFVIEQSGRISNVYVKKDLGAGCTIEALRLLHTLTWQPASVNGKAVRVQMVSSIGFGVQSNAFHEAFNQGSTGR